MSDFDPFKPVSWSSSNSSSSNSNFFEPVKLPTSSYETKSSWGSPAEPERGNHRYENNSSAPLANQALATQTNSPIPLENGLGWSSNSGRSLPGRTNWGWGTNGSTNPTWTSSDGSLNSNAMTSGNTWNSNSLASGVFGQNSSNRYASPQEISAIPTNDSESLVQDPSLKVLSQLEAISGRTTKLRAAEKSQIQDIFRTPPKKDSHVSHATKQWVDGAAGPIKYGPVHRRRG